MDDKSVEHVEGGWTEARVKWLDSAAQEKEEKQEKRRARKKTP